MAAPERAADRPARPAVGARARSRAALAPHVPFLPALGHAAGRRGRRLALGGRPPRAGRCRRGGCGSLVVIAATLAVLGTLSHGERHRGRHGVPGADGGREAARDARRRATSRCWSSSRTSCCTRRCCATSACRSCPTCWPAALFADCRADARARRQRAGDSAARRAAPHGRPAAAGVAARAAAVPAVPAPARAVLGHRRRRVGAHRPRRRDDAGRHLRPQRVGRGRVPRALRRRDAAAARSATGAARCCTSSTGAAGAGRSAQAFPVAGRAAISASRSTTRSRSSRPTGPGSWRSTCPPSGRSARPTAATTSSWSRRAASPRCRRSACAPTRASSPASNCRSRCAARALQLPPEGNPRSRALARATRQRARGDPLAIAAGDAHDVPRAAVRLHARPAEARRQRDGRVPVRDAARLLRALRVGLHAGDARRGRAGARRHRLPGRRVQPDRRLPDRAPVGRARLVRDLGRRAAAGCGSIRRRPWRRSASSAA